MPGRDTVPDVQMVAVHGGAVGDDSYSAGSWTFLTNHSHVLICIARDPTVRLRDVAEQVGITERAVQGIVRDLELAGCLERHRVGRRNHYRLDADRPMRHPVEGHHTVADLLATFTPEPDAASSRSDGDGHRPS